MSTDKLAHSAPGRLRNGYEVVRLGGYVWLVGNAAASSSLRMLLENPAELFVNPVYVRKPGVIRVESQSLIVKRYSPKGFSERIKQIFRGPRARQAFQWAARLQQLGITTITPLAAGHACCRPWESYLVSEELQPTQGLQEFAAANKSSLPRRPILAQLASIMAVLHNHGICHRDAHLANFIIHSGNRVVLTDLDGLRKRCCITDAGAANDLKRLLDYSPGSQREHLRFLMTYVKIRARWGETPSSPDPVASLSSQGSTESRPTKSRPAVSARSLISHLRSQQRGPGPLSQT